MFQVQRIFLGFLQPSVLEIEVSGMLKDLGEGFCGAVPVFEVSPCMSSSIFHSTVADRFIRSWLFLLGENVLGWHFQI